MIRSDALIVIRAQLRRGGARTAQELIDAAGWYVVPSNVKKGGVRPEDRLAEVMDYLVGIGEAQVIEKGASWWGLDHFGRRIQEPRRLTLRASCHYSEVESDGMGSLRLREAKPHPKPVQKSHAPHNPNRRGSVSSYQREAADLAVAALRAGKGIAEAASAAGITESTLRSWRRTRPSFHARCLEVTGGRVGRARTTAGHVDEIRRLLSEGFSCASIAKTLGIGKKPVEREAKEIRARAA